MTGLGFCCFVGALRGEARGEDVNMELLVASD